MPVGACSAVTMSGDFLTRSISLRFVCVICRTEGRLDGRAVSLANAWKGLELAEVVIVACTKMRAVLEKGRVRTRKESRGVKDTQLLERVKSV